MDQLICFSTSPLLPFACAAIHVCSTLATKGSATGTDCTNSCSWSARPTCSLRRFLRAEVAPTCSCLFTLPDHHFFRFSETQLHVSPSLTATDSASGTQSVPSLCLISEAWVLFATISAGYDCSYVLLLFYFAGSSHPPLS